MTEQERQEFNLKHQREAMEELERARRERGIRLCDMEDRSGVSVNSVYAWRANIRSPQLGLLVALAESLGFEIIMRRRK